MLHALLLAHLVLGPSYGTSAFTGDFVDPGTKTPIAAFRLQTIGNLEAVPKTVRYGFRCYPASPAGVSESTCLYLRVDPVGVQNMATGFYMEVTDAQEDTEAGAFKTIHYGHGDAHYTALFANGVGYESASFYNGSRNFISTNQRTAGGGTDFGNTTLFNAVWGDDGTGGSTTPAIYGMYYASLSLGHSFRTRLHSAAAPGFAWGRVEWGISEYDLSRYRVAIYNTGETHLASSAATSGSPLQAGPSIKQIGSYWNGSTAVDKSVVWQPSMDGSGNPYLFLQLGTAGAESSVLVASPTSVDLLAPLTRTYGAQTMNYGMLGSATCDTRVTTKQTIFTVPTGHTARVDRVLCRSASAAITSATATFGWNSSANDVLTSCSLTSMSDSTVDVWCGTRANPQKAGAAGAVFGYLAGTQEGTNDTVVCEAFGVLY